MRTRHDHDLEPALDGAGWMRRWVDRWYESGARRFICFRELAAAVGRPLSLAQDGERFRLTMMNENAPFPVRPLPINLWIPGGQMPDQISCSIGSKLSSLSVKIAEGGYGRVFVAGP